MQNQIIHLSVFAATDKLGNVIYNRKILNKIHALTGNNFLTSDKSKFYEYANYVNVMKGYAAFYKVMSNMQQQKAKELIKLIEENMEH